MSGLSISQMPLKRLVDFYDTNRQTWRSALVIGKVGLGVRLVMTDGQEVTAEVDMLAPQHTHTARLGCSCMFLHLPSKNGASTTRVPVFLMHKTDDCLPLGYLCWARLDTAKDARAAATADSAPLGLLTDIFLRGAVNAPEEARGDCCTTLRFQGKPDVFLEAESNEERTAWMTELRLVLASRKPIVGPDETNEIESSVAAMRALANAFVPSRASDSKAHPTSHAAPALAKVAAPDDDDHALAFLVEWMRSAGLSSSATLASYAARLILRGFDVPAALAHLTAADLEAMGIHKIGHQRLLLAAAQPEGRAAGAGSQGVVEPSAPPAELETHVDVPMFHADDSAIPNTTSEGTVAAMPCAAGAPAIPLCVTD